MLWKHHVSLLLQIIIISTDEDPSLRIDRVAIINLRGVSTKLYFNCSILSDNTVASSKYNFVETPRKFTTAKLSIRYLGSSSVLPNIMVRNSWYSEYSKMCRQARGIFVV